MSGSHEIPKFNNIEVQDLKSYGLINAILQYIRNERERKVKLAKIHRAKRDPYPPEFERDFHHFQHHWDRLVNERYSEEIEFVTNYLFSAHGLNLELIKNQKKSSSLKERLDKQDEEKQSALNEQQEKHAEEISSLQLEIEYLKKDVEMLTMKSQMYERFLQHLEKKPPEFPETDSYEPLNFKS
ncbi:MAG: hypothetical protein AAGG81_00045 [Chlamydiota bacterium]